MLKAYNACDISDALLKLKVPNAGFLPDLKLQTSSTSNTSPSPSLDLVTIAPASTVTFVSKTVNEERGASNIPKGKHWVDLSVPETIVVISQPEGQKCAVVGGIMGERMKYLDVKGVVVDGRVRDLEELGETGLPVSRFLLGSFFGRSGTVRVGSFLLEIFRKVRDERSLFPFLLDTRPRRHFLPQARISFWQGKSDQSHEPNSKPPIAPFLLLPLHFLFIATISKSDSALFSIYFCSPFPHIPNIPFLLSLAFLSQSLHADASQIWSKSTSIVGAGAEAKAYYLQTPLNIDGTKVNPGDLVVSDPMNGVVVIPQENVEDVLELLPRSFEADEMVKGGVKGGMSVAEAFETFR